MMARRSSVVVLGNSVAAMFAAISLDRAGCTVVLVSPSARLGGHFAGLEVAGHIFDAGMVFLEFTSFNMEPGADISSYDPTRRNDVGRFLTVIERTLQEFADWREVPTPRMRVDGSLLPDLLIANQLSSLHSLAPNMVAKIRYELQELTAGTRGPLHTSRKATDALFLTYDLETVSLANHGQTFHELFIEPFCRKVTAQSTAVCVPPFHRMAWLPLFYPETLLRELDGNPQSLPATVFSYPTAGTLASVVRQVETALRSSPGIAVVAGKPVALTTTDGHGPFTLTTSAGQAIHADALVWASAGEELLTLCGHDTSAAADKTTLVLASVLVRSELVTSNISTILIPESPHLPFRVTNQTYGAGVDEALSRISCEWNVALLPEVVDRERVGQRVRDALCELNVISRGDAVTEVRVDILKGALPLPTGGNVERSVRIGAALDALLPTVPRVGSGAPFGAASLNDQIIQGLKLAHDLRWMERA